MTKNEQFKTDKYGTYHVNNDGFCSWAEFAEYILNEEDLISKMEIIFFLAPKLKINFDKSVVFKTEIARMFLKYTNLKVDNNLVLTACLLCNCKKVDDSQKIGKLKIYAKEGAEYLEQLGFDKRFCKIWDNARVNG